LVLSKLAMGLVASVERKGTGALLLGLVGAGLVPAMRAFFCPRDRVAGGVAALAVLAVVFVVTTQLDWRALKLGLPLMLLVFVIAQVSLALLARGRLERLPMTALIAAAVLAA